MHIVGYVTHLSTRRNKLAQEILSRKRGGQALTKLKTNIEPDNSKNLLNDPNPPKPNIDSNVLPDLESKLPRIRALEITSKAFCKRK